MADGRRVRPRGEINLDSLSEDDGAEQPVLRGELAALFKDHGERVASSISRETQQTIQCYDGIIQAQFQQQRGEIKEVRDRQHLQESEIVSVRSELVALRRDLDALRNAPPAHASRMRALRGRPSPL